MLPTSADLDDSSSDSLSSSSGHSSSSSDCKFNPPPSPSSSVSSVSSGPPSDFLDDSFDENCSQKRRKRVCIQNYCDETVQAYSERKFIRTFRLPRDVVNMLIEKFAETEYFEGDDGGKPKIPPHKQIYCFLWFVGHQVATYEEVTDRFDLAPDTVYNIITRVAEFLISFTPEYVKWPTEAQSNITKAHYEQKSGLKKVKGSIDGTQIRINKPRDNPRSYLNRKGYYSIQVQIVCDHLHRIIHFSAGYPGSVHDARVYRISGVYQELAEMDSDGWLLGDPAYPCSKYLVTPFKDNGHLLPYQKEFNKALSECRVDSGHIIGILKQRFRILYHMRLQPGIYTV
ncbi:hypothetical protein QAD02_017034 [Eretmocerus hayati]|uniref:Uncharacterized protein n=1 Tax=Eretmocerus hayati TaxID=131215 RepID=A0ACC2PD40_9HYME|nr:hypothetical protein QAD02_017034 [Eretmocerus hayati]